MKLFVKLLLSLFLSFFIIRVSALEIPYSEWSETKPNVEEYLIESEDRYLFYKEKEINIEYLPKDEFKDKLYDLDDYKLSEESELLDSKPLEKEDREIIEVESEYDNANEIKKVKLSFDIGVYISEIDIKNVRDNIYYEVEYDFINDGDFETKGFIKDLVITFNEKHYLHNLNILIYYDSENENDSLSFKYLNEDDKELYYANFDFKANPFSINSFILDKVSYKTIKYKYIDKLYKTYEIEKEYTDEYYTELDGYIKDESTKKTFYRYVTSSAVIVDARNNVVKDPDTYCVKEYCALVYITKEEQEEEPEEESVIEEEPEEETPNIPINPKTLDNIGYYFIMFFSSLIIMMIVFKDRIRKIFLVLSNRFKRI